MIRIPSDVLQRLALILVTLEREDTLLQGVTRRLFDDHSRLDDAWLDSILTTPEGIDRLESFGAKFGRMQDTLMGKALPTYLHAVLEPTGSVIDNLNRAEALGIIEQAQDWMEMRALRNRLVHEYLPGPEVMLASLERAHHFIPVLQATYTELQYRATRIPGWKPELMILSGKE
ncbi:nucleotidyltransferase substrate binding protein [Acidithiobacillus montserratensis]|uniref:Nucleotidyltransferase substrate binding protein n=1 Tax=Acidithiobacillus montserratensis TaxID=2729135 RepID=A0ACD5HBX2_9PROT|nr:nucleotidyltransferase substrate binding protein [Acidithiobacillus montserratensis]MBU2748097.1 hypothetical protein [Acidithiobacillus montserratensis]